MQLSIYLQCFGQKRTVPGTRPRSCNSLFNYTQGVKGFGWLIGRRRVLVDQLMTGKLSGMGYPASNLEEVIP
jgi:hypothetical protein